MRYKLPTPESNCTCYRKRPDINAPKSCMSSSGSRSLFPDGSIYWSVIGIIVPCRYLVFILISCLWTDRNRGEFHEYEATPFLLNCHWKMIRLQISFIWVNIRCYSEACHTKHDGTLKARIGINHWGGDIKGIGMHHTHLHTHIRV